MVEIPEQRSRALSHTIHSQSTQSDSQNSTTDRPGEQEDHTRDCAPVGPEPAQGSLNAGSMPTELVLIALRKQQLKNRRAMLQNVQQFRTRAREAVGSTEEDGEYREMGFSLYFILCAVFFSFLSHQSSKIATSSKRVAPQCVFLDLVDLFCFFVFLHLILNRNSFGHAFST